MAAGVHEALPLWRVPADRMKLELGLRADDAFEHVVPLSLATVDVLRAIRPITGRAPLPFCTAGDRKKGAFRFDGRADRSQARVKPGRPRRCSMRQ